MNGINEIDRRYLPIYNCNVCSKVGTEYILYLYEKTFIPAMPEYNSSVFFVYSKECIEYVKLLVC